MSAFTLSGDAGKFGGINGFRAAGVHCDIRNKSDQRLDLALVVSECPCTVAGVFTRNKLAAAPVRLGRQMLETGDYYKGFVANSGNANACTGPAGMDDAIAMQKAAAKALDCEPGEIFVCSTGRIGERLPMDRVAKGISEAARGLDDTPGAWTRAADAILTSDTCNKVCHTELEVESDSIRLFGMAKGAGMIEPNMATMLAYICTDAALSPVDAQRLLKDCADSTFNAITVDGDESTNDTVLLFANGSSGVYLEPGNPGWDDFRSAVQEVCHDLAMKIVGDGEKITKVVEICIEGAATGDDAAMAARAIANSLLVKSSWYGNDPNWGRLMDALGYSGAAISEESVSLQYVDVGSGKSSPVFEKGQVVQQNKTVWASIVANRRFGIRVNLGQGKGACRIWSTDLTEGYVNFNKSE